MSKRRPSSKKSPRPRTQRRAKDRALDGFAKDAERLLRLSVGGSAERPVELGSASEVDPWAKSQVCPVCREEQRMVSHDAIETPFGRQRQVVMQCRSCGRNHDYFIRLGPLLS